MKINVLSGGGSWCQEGQRYGLLQRTMESARNPMETIGETTVSERPRRWNTVAPWLRPRKTYGYWESWGNHWENMVSCGGAVFYLGLGSCWCIHKPARATARKKDSTPDIH